MAETIVNSSLLTLHGLYVHGGQAYSAPTSDAVRSISEHECKTGDAFVDLIISAYRAHVDRVRRRLAEKGIDVPVVAVGSTPTLCQPPSVFIGINEIHPGNYTLFDAHQYALGSCTKDEVAVSVLTRVVCLAYSQVLFNFTYYRLGFMELQNRDA